MSSGSEGRSRGLHSAYRRLSVPKLSFEEELKEAIEEFGEEIVDELRLPALGRHFRERLLWGLIKGTKVNGVSDKSRLADAMEAVFGARPRKEDDDNVALELMTVLYVRAEQETGVPPK